MAPKKILIPACLLTILLPGLGFAEDRPGQGTLFERGIPGCKVITLDTSYGVRSLKSEVGEDGLWLIERLNWRDRDHMKKGTRLLLPVVVFEDYDYDGPPPWEEMDRNPLAGSVDNSELIDALEQYI